MRTIAVIGACVCFVSAGIYTPVEAWLYLFAGVGCAYLAEVCDD